MFTYAQLVRQAELLELQADEEDERARHLTDNDIFRKIGVSIIQSEHGGKHAALVEQLRKWDKNGKGTIGVAEFRMGVKAQPPFGLGLVDNVKDVDDAYYRIERSISRTQDGADIKAEALAKVSTLPASRLLDNLAYSFV